MSILLAQENKIITSKSLDGKSLEELRLMRNDIYARYGYPFKNYELYAYFMGQGWYKPDTGYNDEKLSKTDWENINIIEQKEKKHIKDNFITKNRKVKINFDNAINKFQFDEFTDEEIKKLCTNGFVVTPAKYEQLFYLYEENDYKGVASFITTDAVLQLYHIFFDFTLRNLEEKKLLPILKNLTQRMMEISEELYNQTNNPEIKEAARRNLAYFSVPYYFLTKDTSSINPAVWDMVSTEVERCNNHSIHNTPFILNPDGNPNYVWKYDYTQYIPRGHYTRTDSLKRFFMAMLWYGQYALHANLDVQLELTQTLLITHQLYSQNLVGLWETIYEPTVFYVGLSDDLGPQDYKVIIDRIFGIDPKVEDFANKQKLKEVQKLAEEFFKKKTRISPAYVDNPPGPEFRFMGQRYIPDSEILQRLTHWPERPFPKGLDVMAVFSSRIAKDLLLNKYQEQKQWPSYKDNLDALTKQFNKLTHDDWHKNLYYSWLWCLKGIIELTKEHKYPFFMQNDAWLTKSLNTSLASWSELRHDVILYAKPSGAQCGDGEEVLIWHPEPPKGYVEPNVEFYKRMYELLSFTKEGLHGRDLLTETMEEKFDLFVDLVAFLKNVSIKELENIPRTLQEYDQIRIFGTLLENLTITVMTDDKYVRDWWELVSDADKNIAVVADVHTSQSSVLEEGVGYAYEIYVIVEIGGLLKLTRGAVFSYYEFVWPADDRLTDEKWQEILKQEEEPPLPDWIDIYYSPQLHKLPKPVFVPDSSPEPGWHYVYTSGC